MGGREEKNGWYGEVREGEGGERGKWVKKGRETGRRERGGERRRGEGRRGEGRRGEERKGEER